MEHRDNIMHIYKGKLDNEFYQLLDIDGLYGRFLRLNNRLVYRMPIIGMKFWV